MRGLGQNAGSRLILANHGSTTMMTGNTTQAVIDLVDILRGLPEENPQARSRLKLLVPAILALPPARCSAPLPMSPSRSGA
jgi:uncharacterized membrane protein YoaK (UPF0700 family)